MNRFQNQLFDRRRGVFIPFFMLGDPDPRTSLRLMRTAIEAGADALELGIPFSDPIADGPTIQRAATRARQAGANVESCLTLIEQLRASTDVPLGLLLYYNLVLQKGLEQFSRRLANLGVDAVVVADLPAEQSAELEAELSSRGVGFVHLIAPNTSPSRAVELIERSTAFTYVVSRFGTTGARACLDGGTTHRVRELRPLTRKALVVGFGISRPDQYRSIIEAGADGVIVGSALVRRIEDDLGDPDALEVAVRKFVHSFVSQRSSSSCLL